MASFLGNATPRFREPRFEVARVVTLVGFNGCARTPYSVLVHRKSEWVSMSTTNNRLKTGNEIFQLLHTVQMQTRVVMAVVAIDDFHSTCGSF
jgi:hypothetical protein